MTQAGKRFWIPVLALALAAAPVPAQAGKTGIPPGRKRGLPPASPFNHGKKKARKKKLRWPKLPAAQKRKAKAWIYDLAHKNPLVVRKAEQNLESLGPAVLPLLLSSMSDSLPVRNPALEKAALAVVRKEEAPLLAPFLFHHLVSVRRLVPRLLARAGNRVVLPALKKALAKEKDPKAREGVILALCSMGDTAGLPGLFALARKDFFGRRDEILRAARALRGKAATRWLLGRLAGKDRKDQITALRLLALAGTRDAVPSVAPFLDAKNHALALEAINTLRSIVDGKKPMKHISVFQLIQLRKDWKARVGGLK